MPRPVISDELHLLIQLDRTAHRTLGRQLFHLLRAAVLRGAIAPGRRLPASRSLAAALGVSRNLVEAAYDELAVEGYLERRHGSGTYVIGDFAIPSLPPVAARPLVAHTTPSGPHVHAPLRQPLVAFMPGVPDITPLPLGVWRTVWRDVAARLPPGGYLSPAGDRDLRAALADYLAHARGLVCPPEAIIITSSALQGVDLLARATLRPGDAVGFEEPGYRLARATLQAREVRTVSIPVDDDGLVVRALPHDNTLALIYVTPSHQFPLGGRLPVSRRMRLLEWAVEHECLIVEDDYDSEFRFDAPPLPSLAGLDQHQRVVYVGTFSKTLTPALRIGFLVVRDPDLRQRIEQFKVLTDMHASWPAQRALHTLIVEGHLERHVRRMRRLYAAKRARLCEILAPLAPHARTTGMEAGLHLVLLLDWSLRASDIAHRARQREVLVLPLDAFFQGEPDRQGLVLGYGGLTLDEITAGGTTLVDVISEFVENAGRC